MKTKYDDAIIKVDAATSNLKDLFKRKVIGIKEKSALFFAKIEIKLKECTDDVLQVSKMFHKWQETLQSPT